jgi:molybdopterin synthase catalytic subunit/molybdopterin synthase sulfur carrier subunit
VTVTVLAFARLRELLGFAERRVALPAGATLDDLWTAVAVETPAIAGLRASTRFARNGALAPGEATLGDGDEIALLPPLGGG